MALLPHSGCSTSPPLECALDHFKVYSAVGPQGPIVSLIDQFGVEGGIQLGNVVFFANPVDKLPLKRQNPNDHLTWYQVPLPIPLEPPRMVQVYNQFGGQLLAVGQPLELLVPSGKNNYPVPGYIPAALDHYKCYAASGIPIGAPKTLVDQFISENVTVFEPVRFCNPVSKNGGMILSPSMHLTCYRISPETPFPAPLIVSNQFGPVQNVSTFQGKFLCVPSKKLAFSTCGDLTVGVGEQCEPPSGGQDGCAPGFTCDANCQCM